MDDAQKVFNMLGFQYKPIEKSFLKDFQDKPDMIKTYNEASYSKKIYLLDKYAQIVLGL